MSISVDRSSPEGHFQTFPVRPRRNRHTSMVQLECHACGYQAEDPITPPAVCPKCHGSAWERSPRPGSILENAVAADPQPPKRTHAQTKSRTTRVPLPAVPNSRRG